MNFKENLKSKRKLDRLLKKLLAKTRETPERDWTDLPLLRELLDQTDFQSKQVRALDLFVRPLDGTIKEILVHDMGLPVYHTAEREVTFDVHKRLKINIPAGISSGKKLRSVEMGSPGVGKGPAGDLYIEIQVRPSPVFKRVGNDLEMILPVSLNEAILGGEVEIPTVEKPIKLRIPPGANTGQRLRVKNKGVLDAALKIRGHLIVILQVVLPSKIDNELKEVIKKWSKNHSYNPRRKPED
jgi:hypothetical protein